MQRRIIAGALVSVLVVLVSLGVLSDVSVRNEIQHSLNQGLELAEVTANYTDHLIQLNLARLFDVSLSGVVDLGDGDWEPERRALESAYRYSMFTDGLFMVDDTGRVLLAHPEAQIASEDLEGIPDLDRAFREERPFLTGIHLLKKTGRRAIFAFAPLKDRRGRKVGVVGGEVDPTSHFLRNAIRSISADHEIVVELVDDQGFVIASNNPGRVFACSDRERVMAGLIASKQEAVFQCHRCHIEESGSGKAQITTDILAFSSLREAPWGVAVRQAEASLYAPSVRLKRRFVVLGLIVVGSALFLAWGLSRSIVNPVRKLTEAAGVIAGGDFEQPIRTSSRDEIGELTESFETMRQKLAEFSENLQNANLELEQHVEERTAELQSSRAQLQNVLQKFITIQEDERKRVARELHDDTLQAAAALGLSIELASMRLTGGDLKPPDLMQLKRSADSLIDGINRMIRDLRPPMLDDLGLESAIRWLLEKNFAPRGIRFQLTTSPDLRAQLARHFSNGSLERLELMLFRIVQEGITNIAKHAQATAASVKITAHNGGLDLVVQDNGVGFDETQIQSSRKSGEGLGYGIMGLRERAGLLNGQLRISSSPGSGTTLSLYVRFPAKGA